MIQILRLILTQMVLSLRSRADLQVENLALRHQIEILKRTAPKRARLTKTDRLIFTWLLRLWPKSAQLVRIVHPKTLVRWHREGFRVYWRWKSRRRGGRPKARNEVRALIRQMGAQNLWLPNIPSGRIPSDSERHDMTSMDDRDRQSAVVVSRLAAQVAQAAGS